MSNIVSETALIRPNILTQSASPSAMMNELDWETLSERRVRLKAILMYKIRYDLIDMPGSIFQQSNTNCCYSQAVFNIQI